MFVLVFAFFSPHFVLPLHPPTVCEPVWGGRQTGNYPETGFEEVGRIGTDKSAVGNPFQKLLDDGQTGK
jgi:hypothetical protein